MDARAGEAQSGGRKIRMIASSDGIGGVSTNYSSFVPSPPEVEIVTIQMSYTACLKFLQSGFAFKICDSLISCAAHKK
jgi:hypothetical protein